MMAAKGTGLEEGANPPLPDSSHSVIPPCYHTLSKNFAVVPNIIKMTFWWFGYPGLSDAKRIAAWNKNWFPDTFICIAMSDYEPSWCRVWRGLRSRHGF